VIIYIHGLEAQELEIKHLSLGEYFKGKRGRVYWSILFSLLFPGF